MLLRVLHESIASRAEAIERSHGSWPCRKGCDSCCTRLAAIPDLTLAEWELLPPVVEACRLTCIPGSRLWKALFDLSCARLSKTGLAGFMRCGQWPAGRMDFTWTGMADSTVGLVEGLTADVVWGNGAAVEAELDALGQRRDLLSWWRSRSA